MDFGIRSRVLYGPETGCPLAMDILQVLNIYSIFQVYTDLVCSHYPGRYELRDYSAQHWILVVRWTFRRSCMSMFSSIDVALTSYYPVPDLQRWQQAALWTEHHGSSLGRYSSEHFQESYRWHRQWAPFFLVRLSSVNNKHFQTSMSWLLTQANMVSST